MKLFRFLTRVVVGAVFVGHGTQKLFGWFGGHGLEGTSGFFESLGLRPGRRNAIAAGAAETGGGALLAAGLATPLAGAAITGTMITAVRHVHWRNGPWSADGGWEFNAVLVAAVLGLVEAGPGEFSLDHLLGTERSGVGWALAALGAGAAGSLAASYVAQREAAAAAEPAAVAFQRAPEPESQPADVEQAHAAPTGGT